MSERCPVGVCDYGCTNETCETRRRYEAYEVLIEALEFIGCRTDHGDNGEPCAICEKINSAFKKVGHEQAKGE